MPFQTIPAPEALSFASYPQRDSAPPGSKLWAYTQSDIRPTGLAPLTKPGAGASVAPSLAITVSLNRAQSWVLKAHTTDTKLLEHERLHYMIAACVGLKLYNQLIAASKPTVAELQKELTRLNTECAALHKSIGTKYDAETDHGVSATGQATWASKVRGWYTSKKITW